MDGAIYFILTTTPLGEQGSAFLQGRTHNAVRFWAYKRHLVITLGTKS
jgi:hypothetical protein